MKYSNATNYALHTMIYLIVQPGANTVGVQELAEMQQLSPTYLSKILTKLTKAGLIESTPGAKGGYKISRIKHEISFLDVIHAIEGETSLFDCSIHHEGCLIENVMRQAEENMKDELKSKLLIDTAKEVESKQNKGKNSN
ncbi:Rrf2 family transcriptional regulator [Alkalihalobacillus alcalophilus ATCC 27647 = CGMCC 1.3604]|uniref:Rrf2 family transcriptional regulator n=1 Tax=Alkalihalobacillus alcalophilus ATCC 27647 = CGMCC 1.3604 TaxID=1218173 RepID=A0A094WKW5_ALKAL|nr:Rrf2 family transcriptional regulator [Alkalihalobacillus alcalophilus]KGA98389.1 Rrf2 family transcriptional regulator [Alkalihalobacillus alcalophilus ATCC 27647 = CGMCC 1.3604]MED1563923.1 Rrf2 family transcriptional regulator [Alkalihalobacillus alcalophilus]THG91588.1 Rrf2 family transcriptional regulator [Alkalihalobacillus alcalophilus ATCC 27647 = CGMCC 1.3604]